MRPPRPIPSLAVVPREPPVVETPSTLSGADGSSAAAAPALAAELLTTELTPEDSEAPLGEPVDGTLDIHAGWVELVERIRAEKTDGMEELYQLFSRGIRFYLCRQLGPQELDDKVHDTFVVVVQAIRRGS